jgi:hypothetical protein
MICRRSLFDALTITPTSMLQMNNFGSRITSVSVGQRRLFASEIALPLGN